MQKPQTKPKYLYSLLVSVMISTLIFPYPINASTFDEIEVKRKELEKVEQQIDQTRENIESKKEENFTLENYVNQLDTEITELNLETEKSQKEIEITESEIDAKREKVEELSRELRRKKLALKSYIQHMSRDSSTSIFELFLSVTKLSKFFRLFNYARSIERKIYDSTIELRGIKNEVDAKKAELENKHQQLKAIASTLFEQQREAGYKKQESETLHGRNSAEIHSLEDVTTNTEELQEQLRNQLFLLEKEGKSVKFTDAIEAARFAEKTTGVEAPLLLGIMSQESGLGRNVGQCRYKGNMHPDQYGVFFDIMKDLRKDPETVFVSCKPASYSGYGGAMGPAQFIPSTWAAYKPRVEEITGRSANPWELTDAMIAIGLYVSAHGGSVMSSSATRAAVGQFFAGSNWQNYPWYIDQVYSKANVFKEQMGRI